MTHRHPTLSSGNDKRVPSVSMAMSAPDPFAPGSIVEHTAVSGLRIVTVRRPSVPVVELRLAVPFGGSDSDHAPTAELLAAVLLQGTSERDGSSVESALSATGGSLRVSVTPERLTVEGAFAANGLLAVLDILGECLADCQRAPEEVLTSRTRLGDRLRAYRAYPRTAAREALLEHCFPGHPLAREVPSPEDVAVIEPERVAELHARALLPRGARLLLVGDLDPASAAAAAERALSAWTSPRTAVSMPGLPAPAPGVTVTSRPGARQAQIRLLASMPNAGDVRYPAVILANAILGGFVGSRLAGRLREQDGLTYMVSTVLTDYPQRSLLSLNLDTSPAQLGTTLAAIREELDRFAKDCPPRSDEIAAARNYGLGSLVILPASQKGIANLFHRLPPSTALTHWLTNRWEQIRGAVDADVCMAAASMAAQNFSGVVLTAPNHVDTSVADLNTSGFFAAIRF
ncbi:M16 family metallopeptidase [Streptomyces griseorubiginosus]|uniref:M16 family metallopeptidase n=1 Tax=Streptomyces griseorubiginosus TaxID=67304 RepID=UPI0036E9CCB0